MPVSNITLCNINEAASVDPRANLIKMNEKKMPIVLTKGIANINKQTTTSQTLLNLQNLADAGDVLLVPYDTSVAQRVIVNFHIATSKKPLRIGGANVIDKYFHPLPISFNREEQGYRVVPLCVGQKASKYLEIN